MNYSIAPNVSVYLPNTFCITIILIPVRVTTKMDAKEVPSSKRMLGMKEAFISHQTSWEGRAKPKDYSELKKRKCENLT